MIQFLKTINLFRVKLKNTIIRSRQAVAWRQKNTHNATTLSLNVKNSATIKVGKGSYGEISVESYENPAEKLIIGNYVSIASQVTFILGGNHQVDAFTTFPVKAHFKDRFSSFDAQTKGPIIVEDEVWIGSNVIVLSGVTLGKGAIVAAGSVVTKDVQPFSIVGGNPCKFIKWRIPEHIVEKRSEVNFDDLDLDLVKNNLDLFYAPLSEENLEKIKELRIKQGNTL